MATLTADGIMQYRHPVVKGKDGRGKSVRRGVARNEQAGRVLDDLNRLIKQAPTNETEATKSDFHADAWRAYFDAFGPPPKKRSLRSHVRKFIKAQYRGAEFPSEVSELKLRIARLEAERDALGAQLNVKSDAEKALTVEMAFYHAQFNLTCRAGASPIQRQGILRRIGIVCEALGLDRRIAELTKADVLAAVETTAPASELERHARLQAAKRFFDFLARPVNEDGLALTSNPASNIEAGSVSKIQRGKQQRDEVQVLDPFVLLPKLDTYSGALVAVLGFAGLRLAEAGALEWEMVNFDAKLIHIRANVHYPALKSVHSYRDICPFPDVWDYLKALKDVSKSPLVFPRVGITKKATWLDTYLGVVKQTYFSIWLKKKLETDTGLSLPEPALRLRRYWQTTMRENGYESLIQAMGGNDAKAVGLPHYAKWSKLVSSAKIAKLR